MSWAIWITGLPGSGKSVLARGAAAELNALGEPVRVLELDEIRQAITPRPQYTAVEREVVYRALVLMAAFLAEVGTAVIIDATAHRRAWRELARQAIPLFAEVQLVCPLEVCRQREQSRTATHAPRGIYARAGQPGATVPGVDVAYEPALDPELLIDTSAVPVTEAAARIVDLARRLAEAAPEPSGERGEGWAIWITGRPGSGKSALAARVAEALALRGVPVRVLDAAEVRRVLLEGSPWSEAAEEIVQRAVVYATKLLTEAGAAVIVDATAPRRAWREAARKMIPAFAEVQLICPSEICLERERAARWGLGAADPAGGGPARPPAAPDIVLDYEESLRPDLALHTHRSDLWTLAEQVLFLVQRLQRLAAARLERPERRLI
ncbi:MAG TPA: adenylyl-sulfate kinase [Methylomirabilota bacterium]|nr:adenylyl-sulfate kinase [Methylomirabilota bacterium]